MDFETEVYIIEEFKNYTIKQKLSLILDIILGREHGFDGYSHIEIEPYDFKEDYD